MNSISLQTSKDLSLLRKKRRLCPFPKEHPYSPTSPACCPGAHPSIYRSAQLQWPLLICRPAAHQGGFDLLKYTTISLVFVVLRRTQFLLLQSLQACTRSLYCTVYIMNRAKTVPCGAPIQHSSVLGYTIPQPDELWPCC